MDASASTDVHEDINKVCGFFFENPAPEFTVSKQSKSTIKYTRLPDFDFDSKVPWVETSRYATQPRLRRFATVDDKDVYATYSLKHDIPITVMTSTVNKRKIVTITENDTPSVYPRFTNYKQPIQRQPSPSVVHKTVDVVEKDKLKQKPRSANSSKCNIVSKPIPDSQQLVKPDIKPHCEVSNAKTRARKENLKNASLTSKEPATPQQIRSLKTATQKTSLSKKVEPPNKCIEPPKSKFTHKTTSDKKSTSLKNQPNPRTIPPSAKTNAKTRTIDETNRNKRVTLIRVPPDHSSTINKEFYKHKGTETEEIYDGPYRIGCNDTQITKAQKVSTANPSNEVDTYVPENISDTIAMNRQLQEGQMQERQSPKDQSQDVVPNTIADKNSSPLTTPTVEFIKTNCEFKTDKESAYDSLVIPNIISDTIAINRQSQGQSQVGQAQEVVQSTITYKNSSPLTTFRVESIKTDCDSKTDKESVYDSLVIPNITLTKGTSDKSKEYLHLSSKSLPNLNPNPIKNISREADVSKFDEKMCKSSSFIIGRATVTYTTRQKIDFHVVSQNYGQNGDKASSNSSLTSTSLSYPLNVVSVYKKELSQHSGVSDLSNETTPVKERDESNTSNHSNEVMNHHSNKVMNHHSNEVVDMKSLKGSYSDGGKLVKPSDVISTIRLDDGFRENGFMCEQFQRELNFIDSFFESLQYLESCSSGQDFAGSKVENWVRDSGFDVKETEYDCLFPKMDDGANMDDSETIAAKSLCLLNLLIRDEQRRAKNLLFVLKMREDALKDFTKSQILWLENKKKQDNIDIPTLKKKQRGALLKLHHECGEMQRMRKALLALSEKRKVALLKTKNNIELKLNNSLNVNEILMNKKKLKRSTVADRNPVPLKCFDLSSSGCDESGPPRRARSEPLAMTPCAEKSIQTGQSLLEPDHLAGSAPQAGQCVTVDGAYLNILFSNLSQPQIFTSGKQYEVNEEALRNIVNSTENKRCDGNELETLIDQIKCKDLDRSSSPSTARSLVDEFDQYYKGLVDDDKSQKDEDIHPSNLPDVIEAMSKVEGSIGSSNYTIPSTTVRSCAEPIESQCEDLDAEVSDMNLSRTGEGMESPPSESSPTMLTPSPLPPSIPLETPETLIATGTEEMDDARTSGIGANMALSSSPMTVSKPSITAAPALFEAEELMRQQLAIEREIKALEQQQSQLLVVREIPDKPPPPYTPPVDARTQLPRRFTPDETFEERVRTHLLHPTETEPSDPLDVFIKDFCLEKLRNTQADESDKPWDACNLLPPKKKIDLETLVIRTASELKDVLTAGSNSVPGGSMGVLGGVSGTRRSDHVDEILFAEWRRREPAWTALHADEADVKNQLFETIFEKILDEAVSEFKRVVLTPIKHS